MLIKFQSESQHLSLDLFGERTENRHIFICKEKDKIWGLLPLLLGATNLMEPKTMNHVLFQAPRELHP